MNYLLVGEIVLVEELEFLEIDKAEDILTGNALFDLRESNKGTSF